MFRIRTDIGNLDHLLSLPLPSSSSSLSSSSSSRSSSKSNAITASSTKNNNDILSSKKKKKKKRTKNKSKKAFAASLPSHVPPFSVLSSQPHVFTLQILRTILHSLPVFRNHHISSNYSREQLLQQLEPFSGYPLYSQKYLENYWNFNDYVNKHREMFEAWKWNPFYEMFSTNPEWSWIKRPLFKRQKLFLSDDEDNDWLEDESLEDCIGDELDDFDYNDYYEGIDDEGF